MCDTREIPDKNKQLPEGSLLSSVLCFMLIIGASPVLFVLQTMAFERFESIGRLILISILLSAVICSFVCAIYGVFVFVGPIDQYYLVALSMMLVSFLSFQEYYL